MFTFKCWPARWYDPQIGRFLREDPLSFTAGDRNLYRYVFNSPTNAVDPTGLQSVPRHGKHKHECACGADCRCSDCKGYSVASWPAGFACGGNMPLGPFLPPPLPPPCCRESKIRENRRRWIRDELVPGIYADLSQEKQRLIADVLIRLTDRADFAWSKPVGWFGKCYEWVDEYQKRFQDDRDLSQLCDELAKQGYLYIGAIYWVVNYRVHRYFGIGHAAVIIELRDGTRIYLDDGWYGGPDHLFIESECNPKWIIEDPFGEPAWWTEKKPKKR